MFGVGSSCLGSRVRVVDFEVVDLFTMFRVSRFRAKGLAWVEVEFSVLQPKPDTLILKLEP